LTELCSVTLPQYKISDELQSYGLYHFCKTDNTIADYLPDNISSESLQRDLMLSVSIWYLNKLIFTLRNDHFNKLKEISRETSTFIEGRDSNRFEVLIPEERLVKLHNYQLLPTNRTKRSRLSRVRKSKVIEFKQDLNDNVNVNDQSSTKKELLKKMLKKKSLI